MSPELSCRASLSEYWSLGTIHRKFSSMLNRSLATVRRALVSGVVPSLMDGSASQPMTTSRVTVSSKGCCQTGSSAVASAFAAARFQPGTATRTAIIPARSNANHRCFLM